MLLNIDPILTGRLLMALDELGHGDAVVVADAHFTASKLARKTLIDMPGLPAPRILAAIRSVLVPDNIADYVQIDGARVMVPKPEGVPDEAPSIDLMASPAPDLLPIQREFAVAAQVPLDAVRLIERFAFYDLAAGAEVIIRSGETRTYGNALLRKGVTPVSEQHS